MSNTKPLVITMGEPAGIGGELLIKAWKKRDELNLPVFFVIDDPARLQGIDPDLTMAEISDPAEAFDVFQDALPIYPIKLNEVAKAGVLNALNAPLVLKSIEMAVAFCLNGEAAGVITNPIQKSVLYEVGFKHAGHTEYLAELCANKTKRDEMPIMMLAAKDLRVVPLTVHIPIKDVSKAISHDLIVTKTRIINTALQSDFGIENPRIAIAGLNPHAGEDGAIGFEDRDIITPAIEVLKREGLAVSGPHPADTLFHEEARAQYDIALGMYHDQALIPLKTLDFHGGVNCTLGLSVVRTSPDHGTALDIAGKGLARSDSFINAIKMAAEISKKRLAS